MSELSYLGAVHVLGRCPMVNRVAGCQPPTGATPLLSFGLPSLVVRGGSSTRECLREASLVCCVWVWPWLSCVWWVRCWRWSVSPPPPPPPRFVWRCSAGGGWGGPRLKICRGLQDAPHAGCGHIPAPRPNTRALDICHADEHRATPPYAPDIQSIRQAPSSVLINRRACASFHSTSISPVQKSVTLTDE